MRADRDIGDALDQVAGNESPRVGGWEPSDAGCGCGAVLAVIIAILAIWGGMKG